MSDIVTIVVPTFKEVLNLPHLIPAISAEMRKAFIDYEILVVDDDSQDGTEAVVAQLACDHPVQLIVRRNMRGLSSAVIEGFRKARGDFLVCMDADLSHPPDRILALVEQLRDPRVDFVIGSRYCAGGTIEEAWSRTRRLNSWVATLLSRPFTTIKDPMSGFFALRRDTFESAAALSPVGYKIGLELLVKARCHNVREVPIRFVDRRFGASKLNLREQFNYVRHVKRLLDFKYGVVSRILQFAAVGATGAVVDLAVFSAMLRATPLEIARAIAVLVAMTSNFWLNRRLTFSDRRTTSVWRAYVRFITSSSLGALVNWLVSVGLATSFPLWSGHATRAALAGIACGAIFNFVLSFNWVFSPPPQRRG